jgi:hypothetical protein
MISAAYPFVDNSLRERYLYLKGGLQKGAVKGCPESFNLAEEAMEKG